MNHKKRQQVKEVMVDILLTGVGIVIVAVMAVAFLHGAAVYVDKVARQQYAERNVEDGYVGIID